tara:strand:+ start:197 stop:703 length:507 start_codon:yes stop_codon:yes gene_type:complete
MLGPTLRTTARLAPRVSSTARHTSNTSTSAGSAAAAASKAAAPASSSQETGGWFLDLVQRYGYVGVGTYVGVWGATLGGWFGALQAELIAPKDALQRVRELADGAGFGLGATMVEAADNALSGVGATTGNLAVAWVLAKACKPLRVLATVAITPRLAQRLSWLRSSVR